jgi:hypothetical protein
MNNMIPLHPFSDNHIGQVKLFEVDVTLSEDGLLWLRCMVDIAPEDILLPDPADALRTDGLWKTTCFEVFLRKTGETGYIEFNFSPSTQWAAYQFSSHRQGSRDFPLPGTPETHIDFGAYWLSQESTVQLPPDWAGQTLDVNITAVIEGRDGHLGYWALKHPTDSPDFHHPDCFALPLQAGEAV